MARSDASTTHAAKKTLGRKRHILTDTLGLLLGIVVHPADIQDRDGAEPLLRQARRQFPFIERIIGDADYQGPKMAAAVQRTGPWDVHIIDAATSIASSCCPSGESSAHDWLDQPSAQAGA